MKTGAEKASSITSKTTTHTANQPFFRKAGGGDFFAPSVQMKMTVNKPGDKFEQEANTMAAKVMRMPAPAAGKDDRLQRAPEDKLQKKEEDKIQKAAMPEERLQKAAMPEDKLQKKEDEKLQKAPANEDRLQRKGGDGAPAVTSNVQSAIHNTAGAGGQPLSADVRSYMEPRFNADFSAVRIHNDGESAQLSDQLSARAFTYQNHVFFSQDQYQPGTSEGKQLLAHELTHTIQQGHAIQRSPEVSMTTTPPPVQRFLGIDIPSWQDVLDWLAEKAYNIPGYRMFTIVIGVNPINGESADRSAANILRAIVEFLPGGKIITDALEKYGVFEKAGSWVEGQLKRFANLLATVKSAVSQFMDDIDFLDVILHPVRTWERAVDIFTSPVNQIIEFIGSIFQTILQFIRDAVLMPLAALAQGKPGFDLLCAILGKNPITNEPVPRNADTLIGGFMKLIGQEEIWENIKKGNAVQKAWQWFNTALQELFDIVVQFPEDFIAMLKSLEVMDFIILPNLFIKVFKVFGNFVLKFYSWAFGTILSLLEIIFSVVAPGVMPYIAKARASFQKIIKNPIGFVGNLVKAGKMGFNLFMARIGEHLKTALIKWITGPLGEAGVYIPKSFELMEIIKLVLSVLGLTWQAIRAKLVKIIPDPILAGLEKTAGILVTLVKDGPVAAWDQIKAELNELKGMLIAQVTQMITTEIVKAAITKLVMFLNPAGAFVQAVLAIWNTISFFVQKIKQIGQTAAAFIDSIAAITAGQIAGAAQKVEATMARTLTVVIAFLAKFAGLGSIPEKIVGIVKKIRAPIDKGLDKIVSWLGNLLKKIKTAISEWWKQKKPFTNNAGEGHTLSFSGNSEDNATLQISTTTQPLTAYLAEKRVEHKDDKDKLDKVAKAEQLVSQKAVMLKAGSKTKDEKLMNDQVVASLTEISQALMDLGGGVLKNNEYPAPLLEPGGVPPTSSGVSLQNKPKMKKGTPTSGEHGTHGWSYIKNKGLTNLAGDKWVQMHLVSETIGGQAVGGNLVPAPNSVNSAWRSGIESRASALINASSAARAQNVVWLTSTVSYYGASPEGAGGAKFAQSVHTKVGLHAYKGKEAGMAKFEKVDAPAFTMSAQIPTPDFAAAKKVSLNTSSGTHLRDLGGVPASIINEIKRNRPYGTIDDFESKMIAALDTQFVDKTQKEYRQQKAAILAVRNNKKVVVKDESPG